MFHHEKAFLTRLSRRLRERLGDRVEAIVAFGSRVRGDHAEWSDLDLLIVVRSRTVELEREIVDLIVDGELESGIVVSAIIKDAASFERERQTHTPFYDNLLREGVTL